MYVLRNCFNFFCGWVILLYFFSIAYYCLLYIYIYLGVPGDFFSLFLLISFQNQLVFYCNYIHVKFIYKLKKITVFKNVRERATAKNYCPVSLLSVVNKVFEKLGLLITQSNVTFFCDFQYGCRSSRSTADCVTVVSDRIARAFNRLELLELQRLIYLRLLTGFGMLVFFTNLSLTDFQVRYLILFHFFFFQ